jgi:hypothetical protein
MMVVLYHLINKKNGKPKRDCLDWTLPLAPRLMGEGFLGLNDRVSGGWDIQGWSG